MSSYTLYVHTTSDKDASPFYWRGVVLDPNGLRLTAEGWMPELTPYIADLQSVIAGILLVPDTAALHIVSGSTAVLSALNNSFLINSKGAAIEQRQEGSLLEVIAKLAKERNLSYEYSPCPLAVLEATASAVMNATELPNQEAEKHAKDICLGSFKQRISTALLALDGIGRGPGLTASSFDSLYRWKHELTASIIVGISNFQHISMLHLLGYPQKDQPDLTQGANPPLETPPLKCPRRIAP